MKKLEEITTSKQKEESQTKELQEQLELLQQSFNTTQCKFFYKFSWKILMIY